MHREISRTSSYIRSGAICALKRLHHGVMILKSLVSLLYSYGLAGITKDTNIVKAKCNQTMSWYQNPKLNVQRGAGGDNRVLSILHLKLLVHFLYFLFPQ